MGGFELQVLSVNVATPRIIGEQAGEPVVSAIGKKPVEQPTIRVGATNLEGDAQANLLVHGGPDKAVYLYPADHWAWWEKEHRLPCRPGGFGENLTTKGGDETMVHIGDRFAWGEAVLEIAQPRVPCAKFQLYTGRADAGGLMLLHGRCGWYFRVLREGVAPTVDARLTRVSESGGPTVREAYSAAFDRRADPVRRRAIADAPGLSTAWRKRLISAAS
jgi:MOSC domain-containing protein YiiM